MSDKGEAYKLCERYQFILDAVTKNTFGMSVAMQCQIYDYVHYTPSIEGDDA